MRARSTIAPSGCAPSRISRKRARLSADGRSRQTLAVPARVKSAVDQRLGGRVHEVEIVAGVVQVLDAERPPIPTQPAHDLDDRIDIGLFFLLRIGVVQPQMARATVLPRQTEIQADALGVADVQVAVGLRRETQAHACRVELARAVVRRISRRAGPVPPRMQVLAQVLLDDRAQEARRAGIVHGVLDIDHRPASVRRRKSEARRQSPWQRPSPRTQGPRAQPRGAAFR